MSKVIAFGGQKVCFDVTIPADKYETWKDLWRVLNGYCKKFAFQLEEGRRNGFRHWQVRLSLLAKRTVASLVTDVLPQIHNNPYDWSLTSDNVHNGPKHFNYVMKLDTRIDGPWTDKDPCAQPPRLTRDVQTFMNLGHKPWHTYAETYAKKYDERKILLVLDVDGDSAKSVFLRYLKYQEIANVVPSTVETAKQLIEFVHGQEERGCYCFNIPRSMKQDGNNLYKLFTAIETLKDGSLYDTRYSTREREIERPQIIVCLNDLPDFSLLTKKRWEILELHKDWKFYVFDAFYYDDHGPNEHYEVDGFAILLDPINPENPNSL